MIADLLESLADRARGLFASKGEPRRAPDVADVDLGEAGARIGGWLPYNAYRPQDRVFVNRDSIGFVLSVTPQTGANASVAERLKGLYARLPTHATMQIHLWASPNVGPVLAAHANLRPLDPDAAHQAVLRGGRPARNGNVFRVLARRTYAHLRRGSRHALASDVAFLVRDFRAFISVTLPGHLRELDQVDKLLEIRDGMLSTLQAAHFPAVPMDADALIALAGEWLNPGRLRGSRAAPAAYDDYKPLAEQIVDRETSGDWSDPTRVVLERLGSEDPEEAVELRFLSVQRTPKTYAMWGMSALVGDMFQDSLQIPCPFLVTMGVSMPDQQAMSTSAVADKVKAERNATGDLAKFTPDMADKNQAWTDALRAMGEGGKLVWTYHQVVLFAPRRQAARAEGALRDLWRARGFELVLDGYIHRVALLQSLPMGMSRPFVQDLQKLKRLELRTSGNTIHLAPLVADGKGTGTPTLLGISRRGQVTTLDFFDAEAGKNVSIVGATGSGKSTLLQSIASAYAARGAKVRVFEAGRSFERLTGRIGGQYVRFTHEARLNVNPFSLVSEPREVDGEMCGGIDDDVALLQPLLAKMASPNEPLDPAIYATLATVIKEEFAARGRAMTVSDVVRRYRTGRLYPDRPEDQRYYDMADMLAPFGADGAYAHYFEGPSTLDFSNDFLVFEMHELSTNPHLRAVVQMILLYKVSQEMLEERRRQKLFIMDEAKEALAGNGPDDRVLAEFLDKLYVRIRKYHGCAITATQDVAHYFTSSYGASIWNQSEFILMGKQSENSIQAIARGEAIRLDEQLRRLLTSISTSSGTFREWYVHSGQFKGVIRHVLNPSTLLLFSNRHEDNLPLDAALERGLSVTEAIDELLAQRGIEEPT